jgi:3-hydroxymyristoyl/3-hydroxydecanoyl-(acyl carrier protein) dehydratase
MVNTTTLTVPTHHPAFDGHFPGAPLLPGVVLLDEVLQAVSTESTRGDGATSRWTIATAKFMQPVRPGDTLTFEHESLANGAVRFAVRSGGGRVVATGTLVPRLDATEAGDGHQAG